MNKIFSYFDRNYHLYFNKNKCIKIKFKHDFYKYNEIIITQEYIYLRSLGNDWYKLQ
jgi:hypothetical protein